jgi:hypothetical protein
MSKIIIHNETSQDSDVFCVNVVSAVMKKGFVSGENQYCWHTIFPCVFRDIKVIALKTRGNTHTFKVRDEK